MGNIKVDDGETSFSYDDKKPQVKQKILRRHKKVIKEINKIWKTIYETMKMLRSHGIDVNDLMRYYVKLFINEGRVNRKARVGI
jgi:hypothetical protein